MRINFDFGDLEAFLAVAELGSFLRSAERLDVSQSAITRRIKKLEESLGVMLFERTTRSLKLTLAAKAFLPRAQAMVDEALEAHRALGDESGRFEFQRSAIISVATIPTSTRHILSRAIKSFRAEGYRARIRILDLFGNDVADAVAEGDADFGISFVGTNEPGLRFQILLEDRFALAIHHNDPLSKRRQIPWSKLADQPVAMPLKGTGNRMLIDNALARARETVNWTYEARHSSTLLELAETGVGVAILPTSAIPTGNRVSVVARPLVEPKISRVIGIVSRTGPARSAQAERLREILVDQCTHDPPSNI